MCVCDEGKGRDDIDCWVQALGNFSLYDYRKPHAVPDELKGAFHVIVADPPYLVRLHTLHAGCCGS